MACPSNPCGKVFLRINSIARCSRANTGCACQTRRLASLHQTYVGLLERGERTPNLDTANAIAHALGKPLWEMITEAGKLQKISNRK